MTRYGIMDKGELIATAETLTEALNKSDELAAKPGDFLLIFDSKTLGLFESIISHRKQENANKEFTDRYELRKMYDPELTVIENAATMGVAIEKANKHNDEKFESVLIWDTMTGRSVEMYSNRPIEGKISK